MMRAPICRNPVNPLATVPIRAAMSVVTPVADGDGEPLGIRGGHRHDRARRPDEGDEKLLMNCHINGFGSRGGRGRVPFLILPQSARSIRLKRTICSSPRILGGGSFSRNAALISRGVCRALVIRRGHADDPAVSRGRVCRSPSPPGLPRRRSRYAKTAPGSKTRRPHHRA